MVQSEKYLIIHLYYADISVKYLNRINRLFSLNEKVSNKLREKGEIVNERNDEILCAISMKDFSFHEEIAVLYQTDDEELRR